MITVDALKSLDIGQSLSASQRFDGNQPNNRNAINVWLLSRRNTVSKTVTRLPGKRYTVEQGTMMTDSHDLVASLVVTRTE